LKRQDKENPDTSDFLSQVSFICCRRQAALPPSAFTKAIGQSLPLPELIFFIGLLALLISVIILCCQIRQKKTIYAGLFFYQHNIAPAVASASYTYVFWKLLTDTSSGEKSNPLDQARREI
jgi:hypothetical protein